MILLPLASGLSKRADALPLPAGMRGSGKVYCPYALSGTGPVHIGMTKVSPTHLAMILLRFVGLGNGG